MIERKTYKADIDRQRPKIFLLALAISCLLFFIVLNWNSAIGDLSFLEDMDEDVDVDMELLDKIKEMENKDKDYFSVKPPQKKAKGVSDVINKVDEVQNSKEDLDKIATEEQLKKNLKFVPTEFSKDAEMKASEMTPDPVALLPEDELPPRVVEELPEFPGGMSQFVTWLTTALKYPPALQKQKKTGSVTISFVVEADGRITNIKFPVQTHTALDAEVLRVIKLMPKWKPAHDHGKPVRSVVAVPVVFAI